MPNHTMWWHICQTTPCGDICQEGSSRNFSLLTGISYFTFIERFFINVCDFAHNTVIGIARIQRLWAVGSVPLFQLVIACVYHLSSKKEAELQYVKYCIDTSGIVARRIFRLITSNDSWSWRRSFAKGHRGNSDSKITFLL